MGCVILTLGEDLGALFLPACPESFKDGAENLYTKYYADHDNGFYDWLRCLNGAVIGVRWFPYEDHALRGKRTTYLRTLKGITVDEDRLGLTVFFSEARAVDEPRSCDQDFLENNLFFTADGKCAISFSTDSLSEKERDSLFGGWRVRTQRART